MAIAQLLLKTLDDLEDDDFSRFNWYLSNGVSDDYEPIPKCRLQNPNQMKTVDEMIRHYGEVMAVAITVEILRLMNNNYAADKLEEACSE